LLTVIAFQHYLHLIYPFAAALFINYMMKAPAVCWELRADYYYASLHRHRYRIIKGKATRTEAAIEIQMRNSIKV